MHIRHRAPQINQNSRMYLTILVTQSEPQTEGPQTFGATTQNFFVQATGRLGFVHT